MSFMRQILLELVCLSLALLPLRASAYNSYLTNFHTVYPNSTLNTSLSCTLCHPGADKTQFTLYGDAFRTDGATGNARFIVIETLDVDHDGFTNLQEINANTNPSDPASKPAPKTAVTSPWQDYQ